MAVVFRCLLGGAAVAVPGKDEPLADAIAGLGATHLSLVATQLYRLLREKPGRAALRRLKAVLLGGGPAPAALIAEAARAGVRLVTSYGSTEMSSQATATRPGDPEESLSTAGRPLRFREISVAADGEILVRGRTLFRGYVEATRVRPARDGAGWFHSGDLGHLDDAGRLIVTGRRDTMFISGGENIHPEEIEREILRFPGVLETIVVPVPDPEFGARPVAFLRMSGGRLPEAGDLERFLRDRPCPASRFRCAIAVAGNRGGDEARPAHASRRWRADKKAWVHQHAGADLAGFGRYGANAVRTRPAAGTTPRGRRDRRMHRNDAAGLAAIGEEQPVTHREGAVAERPDGDADAQPVPHRQRRAVVRLGVDDGKQHVPVADGLAIGQADVLEKVLEGLVRETELRPEEKEPGGIGVVEPDDRFAGELHGAPPSGSD